MYHLTDDYGMLMVDKVVVIDTGVANVASVLNMLKKIGADPESSSNPEVIATATKLILPGVGSYDACMRGLKDRQLDAAIKRRVALDGVSLLGVCLGMQILFEGSDEGSEPGLGLLQGRVVRFDRSKLSKNNRIPNMGWRNLEIVQQVPLFEGLDSESRFYFVHSYHVPEDCTSACAASTHGYKFTAAVSKGNISGVQFHPEKSHKFGMKLFQNFLRI